MDYVLPVVIGIAFWVAVFVAYFTYQNRSRRKLEPGFQYIHIEDDGSARELNGSEQEYLSTDFDNCDSGRPYIKSNYEAKTPNGRLIGFLERRQLPKNIIIRPAPAEENP